MIVAVNTKEEYGKQGTLGINLMPELGGDGSMAYAHSMEQAIAWVKSYPLFQDIEPYSLGDGRFVFWSEWTEKGPLYNLLYEYEEVTHQRQTITLYPENTVFENTGYKSVFSGSALGSLTSEKKSASSRENGKRGGRPRKNSD